MAKDGLSPDDRVAAFGRALARVRAEQKVNQTRLAEHLGLGQSTVSEWERGEKEPGRDAVFEIERFLNQEPGSLSSLLGYVPPEGRRSASFEAVVESDPALTDEQKRIVLGMYREFVKSPRARRVEER